MWNRCPSQKSHHYFDRRSLEPLYHFLHVCIRSVSVVESMFSVRLGCVCNSNTYNPSTTLSNHGKSRKDKKNCKIHLLSWSPNSRGIQKNSKRWTCTWRCGKSAIKCYFTLRLRSSFRECYRWRINSYWWIDSCDENKFAEYWQRYLLSLIFGKTYTLRRHVCYSN